MILLRACNIGNWYNPDIIVALAKASGCMVVGDGGFGDGAFKNGSAATHRFPTNDAIGPNPKSYLQLHPEYRGKAVDSNDNTWYIASP
jgi:hypothetical protein